MKDLKRKTVHATGWVLVSRLISQFISFGYGIILARLLTPDDFGLIAMVMVFTGVATLLLDVGFGQALVHKSDVTEVHYSSIFWLNIGIAIILSVTLFLFSNFIAELYSRTELVMIARVASINYIIGALGFIPRTKLEKNLNFKYISITEMTAMIASGIFAISFAYLGFGYWSLVFQQMIQQLMISVTLWSLVRWWPHKNVSFKAIKELYGYSVSVFGTRLLQYAASNLDKLVLGKYINAHSVGLYDKAQSMMFFPLNTISRSVGSVMFPSLSTINHDKIRVGNIYLRIVNAIALFTIPMMSGMFVVSEAFVYGVLGKQWAGIIPILRILCIAGVFSSIATITGSVYMSQGATSLQLKMNMLTQPIRIFGIIIGLNWGVNGVAVGLSLAIITNTTLTISAAGRLINVTFKDVLARIFPIIAASITMAVIIYFLKYIIVSHDSLLLLSQILVGIIVYWAIIVLFKLKIYRDVIEVFRDAISK